MKISESRENNMVVGFNVVRGVPTCCDFFEREFVRYDSRQEKFFKILRIEMENYPITMTTGMY
jgi:hypothetical protein